MDGTGPVLLLAVLSREPRDTGALVVSVPKVHAGAVVVAGD